MIFVRPCNKIELGHHITGRQVSDLADFLNQSYSGGWCNKLIHFNAGQAK